MKLPLPSFASIAMETITILAASVLAAWIISRFPALQMFVSKNSVTLNVE